MAGGDQVAVNFPTSWRVGEVRVRVRAGEGPAGTAFTMGAALCDEIGGPERPLGPPRPVTPTSGAPAREHWVTVLGPPQQGRCLLLRFSGPAGAALLVDQVRAFAPVTRATEALYRTDGRGPVGVLTGRLYARGPDDTERLLRWPTGRGQVTVTPPTDRRLGLMWLHLVKPTGGQWPARLTLTCDGQTQTVAFAAPAEGWAAYQAVRLPFARPGELSLTLEGEGADLPLALDRLELEPAVSLALGKPYQVQPLPHAAGAAPGKPLPQYPDDGRKLTDTLLAEQFGDGCLVGWLGANPTITLDLGAPRAVRGVRVHAWGGGMGDAYFPRSIQVAVSADGTTWQAAAPAIQPPTEPAGTKALLREWLQTAIQAPPSRYLKLDCVAHGFLLIDEIEVVGNGENLAEGCRYSTVTPADQGPYPDNGTKLTDGLCCTGAYNKGVVVGHFDADPTVTVDLQQAADLVLAAAHVCGGNRNSVCFPAQVTVETSADGVTWSAPVVTTEHPAETGEGITALMEVPLNTRARFVRWKLRHRGFCMVDEVEVYGR